MATEIVLLLASVALSQIAGTQALSVLVNPDSQIPNNPAFAPAIPSRPEPCKDPVACLLVRDVIAREDWPPLGPDPSPTFKPVMIIPIALGVFTFLAILTAVLHRWCGPTSESVVYTRTTNWSRSNADNAIATVHHQSATSHQMATMDGLAYHQPQPQPLPVAQQDMSNQLTVMTSTSGATTNNTTTQC